MIENDFLFQCRGIAITPKVTSRVLRTATKRVKFRRKSQQSIGTSSDSPTGMILQRVENNESPAKHTAEQATEKSYLHTFSKVSKVAEFHKCIRRKNYNLHYRRRQSIIKRRISNNMNISLTEGSEPPRSYLKTGRKMSNENFKYNSPSPSSYRSPHPDTKLSELRERLNSVRKLLNSPLRSKPPLCYRQNLSPALVSNRPMMQYNFTKHNFHHHRDCSPELLNSRYKKNTGQFNFNSKASLSPCASLQQMKRMCTPPSQGEAFPMSPSAVNLQYQHLLTNAEQVEILEYRNIYYFGLKASNRKPMNLTKEEGEYNGVVGDHIAYRYEIVKNLGKGAFGCVYEVLDHKNNTKAALKILNKTQKLDKQGKVEINILSRIREEDEQEKCNILRILHKFKFRGHICFTCELLHINLYEQLKLGNFKGLSLNSVRKIATQLLSSLSLLRTLKIVHCDIKPENILLCNSRDAKVKLADFGSSCFQAEQYYTYIQSRFYRAPEVIIGIPYTPAIDMWSLGCVLVELYTGRPLFPAKTEEKLLSFMIEVLGLPPKNLLEQGRRSHKYFTIKGEPLFLMNRQIASKRLEDVLEHPDSKFIDFLKSKVYTECFEWNPTRRITPEEAKNHPWILIPPRANIYTRKASTELSPRNLFLQ